MKDTAIRVESVKPYSDIDPTRIMDKAVTTWRRLSKSTEIPKIFRSGVLYVTEPSPNLVKCPTLRGPDHGTLSLRLRATSGFLEARFQCVAGYRLQGSSSSLCVDGLWSDSVPICISARGKRTLLVAYSSIIVRVDYYW
jgi:hypothetical protein